MKVTFATFDRLRAYKFTPVPRWLRALPGAPLYTMNTFLAQNTLREEAAKTGSTTQLVLSFGSDHGGFELKQKAISLLGELESRVKVIDCGTTTEKTPVDYPEFAGRVARSVLSMESHFGLLFCGTGLGISAAANKFPGIVASNCRTLDDAEKARLHNAANIAAFGGRCGIDDTNLKTMIFSFLQSPFQGGRHIARVEGLLFPVINFQ